MNTTHISKLLFLMRRHRYTAEAIPMQIRSNLNRSWIFLFIVESAERMTRAYVLSRCLHDTHIADEHIYRCSRAKNTKSVNLHIFILFKNRLHKRFWNHRQSFFILYWIIHRLCPCWKPRTGAIFKLIIVRIKNPLFSHFSKNRTKRRIEYFNAHMFIHTYVCT